MLGVAWGQDKARKVYPDLNGQFAALLTLACYIDLDKNMRDAVY